MLSAKLEETDKYKILSSSAHNYVFNKLSGQHIRWGHEMKDDPQWGLPEIADIEITTICYGVGGKLCRFCYKANSGNGTYMSFTRFKAIHAKLPKSLTQVAFGVDSSCSTNPDWYAIFDYCRNNAVLPLVPNVTVADITPATADKLVSICGAVAVSRYDDKDICYNCVKLLTDRGLQQTNIHAMLSEETYDNVMETIRDYSADPRLSKLNAIVLLSLKPKGRGVGYTTLQQSKFNFLVDYALANNVPLGFDSCSQPSFLKAIVGRPDYGRLEQLSEPCESTCFSLYINVDGQFFPCSFIEDTPGWERGIDVAGCDDFIKDVWMNPRTVDFRTKLLNVRRRCPVYNLNY